jgi:pyridoxal phosphate enzyme (YggS family)
MATMRTTTDSTSPNSCADVVTPGSAPVDPAGVAERLREVRERVALAGGSDVAVVAVTKSFPAEAVLAAVAAGADGIGENYAQELDAKASAIAEAAASGCPVHFIGQLQSNKVRVVARHANVIQSVDRPSLLTEIVRRASGLSVMIQVSPADEPGKGGCDPAEVPALVETARQMGLEVLGLMCVAPTSGGVEAAGPHFAMTRALVDHLGLEHCSMGMSGDLEAAVREGSTMVRIGSALFSERS